MITVLVRLTRRSAITAMAGAALSLAAFALPGGAFAEAPDSARWVVQADEARALLADGALLLDTRGDPLRAERPIPGAIPVAWQHFTNPDLPLKGRLLDDDSVLTEKLRALGVSADRPVIAVADSRNGWGEDGRIVWTLRTLGHTKAYLVDGGVDALLEGGPLTAAAAGTGDFTVRRTTAYEATKEDIQAALGAKDVVILDTREPREYAGETPYGESRGGHIPGAQHIFYKDLVDGNGHLLDGAALKDRLAALGVGADTEVVSYCTGGIRSGFVTAVLRDAGVNARNYAGSMWEWSAAPADAFPLVTN